MEKKEKGYRNLSGLISNTPILQYSNNPVGFQLMEYWKKWNAGVMEKSSDGSSEE